MSKRESLLVYNASNNLLAIIETGHELTIKYLETKDEIKFSINSYGAN